MSEKVTRTNVKVGDLVETSRPTVDFMSFSVKEQLTLPHTQLGLPSGSIGIVVSIENRYAVYVQFVGNDIKGRKLKRMNMLFLKVVGSA